MSWAEVKKLNSNLNIPLNDLIGTNTRILENELDQSTLPYSSSPYRIYNLIPRLANSGVDIENYIYNKVISTPPNVAMNYYNGYSTNFSVSGMLYDGKFNRYLTLYEDYTTSSSSSYKQVEKIQNILYDVTNKQQIILNELSPSEIDSSVTATYCGPNYVTPIRISKNRYLLVSYVEMVPSYTSGYGQTTRYFKITVSDLVLKDEGGYDIRTVEVCKGKENTTTSNTSYSYVCAFCTGRHVEIVLPFPCQYYSTVATSLKQFKHILIDLENMVVLKNENATQSEEYYDINHLYTIKYSCFMKPIFLDEDKCVRMYGIMPNGKINRQIYYNSSYMKEPYFEGYKILKKGNTSFYGLVRPVGEMADVIVGNKMYSFVVESTNIENISDYKSRPLYEDIKRQLFNNDMYIRCIETFYNEENGEITYNITDKSLGKNRISFVNFGASYNIIAFDNMHAKVIGDDILVMTPPYSNVNMTKEDDYNKYNTYNNKNQCYIIRDFKGNNPYIEEIDLFYNEFNVKTDYRNLMWKVLCGNYNTVSNGFDYNLYEYYIPYHDLNAILNRNSSSSTNDSNNPSGTTITVAPAGISISVMKLNKAEDFIKVIKKLLMSLNYIETPLRKDSLLMINTTKVVIEGGKYEILSKNKVKILEDEIYKIYYSELVPYMII